MAQAYAMRSLNVDQLRAFVEVMQRGSFTAAAKALNLSQPAITHQVHELERRFNVTLVERLGKRAYPTEAGEKLIERARELLEDDARTCDEMRRYADGWLGRVRIGTSMTVLMYLLPPILRELKGAYPQLEISLKAGLTSTTLQLLKTNELDLGLCAMPIEDPAFETISLFRDELVAILPTTLGPMPKKVTPAFLCGCPLNSRQRAFGAAADRERLAGAWRSPAETGHGVRQCRGDQEPRCGRLWFSRSFRAYRLVWDMPGRRTRWSRRSVRARADALVWSGCGESGPAKACNSSSRHSRRCVPSSQRAIDEPA